MKASLIVLLLLYLTSAYARRCITTNGVQCCGLVVGIFAAAFSTNDYFAGLNGFFTEEGINVCYSTIPSSVTLYTNLQLGLYDLVASNVDNDIWRAQNLGWNLSIIAGTDGNRGYYLVGNTQTLGGYNSVAALANKNILVDGLNSGFVVGLWKILNDYGILNNVTYTTLGTNRLPYVVAGTYNGQTQYATMVSGTAPYLLAYPAYPLAQLTEHLCPAQGAAYASWTNWTTDPANQADLVSFFRGLLRAYQWTIDPANYNAVIAYLASSNSVDNVTASLIYDDTFKNPAAGNNPYLTLRKLGLKNIVSTRIALGLSNYPPSYYGGTVDSFVQDKFGGFVDQTALRAAQASLGITNNYDTDAGTTGCPSYSTGTIVTVPPPKPALTCSASYSISSQPPSWPTGLTGALSITVNNVTLLQNNGAPGWTISFTAQGSGVVPPFYINSYWNAGSVTQSVSNGVGTYTITNANYNQATPQQIGWTAQTTLPSPFNNLIGVSINGAVCSIATPDTLS